MFYIPTKGDSLGKSPVIFAEELVTNFNDGPASFKSSDSLVIFSRNTKVDNKKRDVKDERNKLGLFTSKLQGDFWSDPEPFAFNSMEYNLTSPALSEDGSFLYFASDMPGGYGGLDLYVCMKLDKGWSSPHNLGSKINTEKNESFPYISVSGELFFASNGHNTMGGLDVFSSSKQNDEWGNIIHINAPINSEYDDFALITDANFETGYFSSNREGNDNIYDFHTSIPQFANCDSIKENEYCFLFYDEYYIPVDTSKSYYEWIFGDGTRVRGKEAEHCFDGPGTYRVELNIIDKQTDQVFMKQTNYEFELLDYEQAYINCVDEAVLKNEISFDASKTNLPFFNVEKYYWDFGDGMLDEGIKINHAYHKKGEYTITLGVVSEKDSLGYKQKTCVEKKIKIVRNTDSLESMNSGNESSQFGNNTTDDDRFIPKQKLEADFVVPPILVIQNLNINNRLEDLQLVFSESFEKNKQFVRSVTDKDVQVDDDLNSNPAKALALQTQSLINKKNNAKIKLIENKLQLLSSQFEFPFNDIGDHSISKSVTPILNELLKILVVNPVIELKIGLHVISENNISFDLASKATETVADYLINHGIEKYRLRTAVYEIKNKLDPKNDNRFEFMLINE
ncbi:PKD domain-containing protein [Labilibaculum sp.]|uniref:PKD domain-containing protein n=1 Tax=Labilibaculum sp. TaxID=2060723 RepID=UPI0035694730